MDIARDSRHRIPQIVEVVEEHIGLGCRSARLRKPDERGHPDDYGEKQDASTHDDPLQPAQGTEHAARQARIPSTPPFGALGSGERHERQALVDLPADVSGVRRNPQPG